MPVGRLLLVQEEDQAPAPLGPAAAALLRRCRGPVSLCPGLMESKLPLWALWDWQFVFVAAVVAAHLLLDEVRRNALLRSLFLVLFLAAALACLYWSFGL